jgi:peroxiredoxin
MDLALLAARLMLAVVFALAGVAKLADRVGSRQAVIDFGLPARLAHALALALPVAELAVAVALVPARTAWSGALGALALLAAFVVGIGYNLARGRSPDCHCFGQLHSQPVGWPTLARNAVLAAIAGLLVWQGPERVGASAFAWLGVVTTGGFVGLILGLLVVVGLAVLAWFLTQILAQQGRILARLEALEVRAVQESTPTRSQLAPNSAPAPQGLPVGAPAPAFALPDLDGRRISLEELLAPRRPALLLFVDPNCGPCSALLPEAARWARDQAEAFTLVVLSRGGAKENRKKVVSHSGFLQVLLQEKYEVSERYSTLGTPSGVLVRPDGRIGSPVAPGVDAIKALVARTVSIPPASVARAAVQGSSAPSGQPGGLGAPAPDIRLRGLDDRWVELKHFEGHETLVLFWNPGCGFCQGMRDDLRAWEARETHGKPRLLVVSTGTAETNRAEGFTSPVVLDSNFSVAQRFGAGGTPSAVLVDSTGRIASEVAVGAPAVLALAAPLEVATS